MQILKIRATISKYQILKKMKILYLHLQFQVSIYSYTYLIHMYFLTYRFLSENNIDGQFNKLDTSSLVDEENILKATFVLQILTLLKKRFLHYRRNYRLLIITLLLPAVFVAVAMGFSLIRPPDDSEDPLQMSSSLYSKFSAEFVR